MIRIAGGVAIAPRSPCARLVEIAEHELDHDLVAPIGHEERAESVTRVGQRQRDGIKPCAVSGRY